MSDTSISPLSSAILAYSFTASFSPCPVFSPYEVLTSVMFPRHCSFCKTLSSFISGFFADWTVLAVFVGVPTRDGGLVLALEIKGLRVSRLGVEMGAALGVSGLWEGSDL